ncbi:non-specific lipid-transfer protein-like 1 [Episyrphus balteatus]|uniref:non-specific lipid-transfer protein-like 1 n=1 Tax=Episyrphus balteatus TaxID=286459 RepID=UPI002485A80A|nr:non-specific lipid-transfer protein-like 1 [Episyrphus balteatus]
MNSQVIIEKIMEKMQAVDPAERTIFVIYQFHFTKADGTPSKSFVFDLKDLKIYEGTTDKADGEVTIIDEDFYALVSKKMSLDEYIASGKAKMSGNVSDLKKLVEKYHI